MTAKEFLKQYEYAERRVKRIETELEEQTLLIDAVKSVSDTDGMPHGNGVTKPTEDRAIRLVDTRMELATARIEAIRVRSQVFKVIHGIPGVEGDVLYKKYVQLLPFESVAKEINYSLRGAYKVHARALKIVEEVLNVTQ